MANIDLKSAGELLKPFMPTDEQRQKFDQTFLGSLLGQAIVLVGLVTIYVAAMLFGASYAVQEARTVRNQFGEFWFWFFVGAPFAIILAFSVFPALWRALREHRLRETVIRGGPNFKPGYFRLHPYDETDWRTFKRLDGADNEITDWLLSAEGSLLYLSGASGVGKSSLLAAHVLPKLREAGWDIVQSRPSDGVDPMKRLHAALVEAESVVARKPLANIPVRQLQKAAKARLRRILVVIDQFEEFLTLHKPEEWKPFSELLHRLTQQPLDNFRLLLVFRSDYRGLLFKLGLPPVRVGKNWQELSPYSRGEATNFLKEGGRELPPASLDTLFRGLDRIEESRGIYRPITLNMVGLVLERMGAALQGDPERLIQSYLTTCLTTGESRDFAKPVLTAMITEAGTKERQSEAEIAKATGLAPWQVTATLTSLERQGLVRPLRSGDTDSGSGETDWEVAHDFLARMLGQLIGRLRSPLAKRLRPMVGPALLVIVLAMLAILYWWLAPYWLATEAAARKALDRQGVTISAMADSGFQVSFGLTTSDAELVDAVANLKAIKSSKPIRAIDLSQARSITNLAPLKGFTDLKILDLRGVTGIKDLDPLKELTRLAVLRLDGASGITTLEPLRGLAALTFLELGSTTGIKNLEPLRGLTSLGTLELRGATGITDLDPLKELTRLVVLRLDGASGITTLEPLRGLAALTFLELGGATGIKDLEPLKGLTALTVLKLTGATGIKDLEPLTKLTELTILDLRGATGIEDLKPLNGLMRLASLQLDGATGIRSLAPLKGRGVHVLGVSENVAATMK